MGENITTLGIDLLGLPTGALLHFGDDACVRATGRRNPCQQINGFEPGLRDVLGGAEDGYVERKGGVVAVIVAGRVVRPRASVHVELPAGQRLPLSPV